VHIIEYKVTNIKKKMRYISHKNLSLVNANHEPLSKGMIHLYQKYKIPRNALAFRNLKIDE